eukprot:Clim_evm27s158 gene=Clim_evmTU27s158
MGVLSVAAVAADDDLLPDCVQEARRVRAERRAEAALAFSGVERFHMSDFGKDAVTEFRQRILERNLPAIFDAGFTDRWVYRNTWGTEGIPAVIGDFGNRSVPVAVASTSTVDTSKAHQRSTMTLKNWWTRVNPGSLNEEALDLYVKDWHLFAEVPEECEKYAMPEPLGLDWMNDYLVNQLHHAHGEDQKDQHRSDYRFVYIGRAGTSTPLHHDVMGSYSWSANVFGRKLWLVVGPASASVAAEWEHSRTLLTRELISEIVINPSQFVSDRPQRWNLRNRSTKTGREDSRMDPLTVYTVLQEPGETIFIPSGWYHEVLNLTDCISVNHNWFCGTNLDQIMDLLHAEFLAAVDSLTDIRSLMATEVEFYQECTKLAGHAAGLSLNEFAAIVLHRWERLDRDNGDEGGDPGNEALRAAETEDCRLALAEMRAQPDTWGRAMNPEQWEQVLNIKGLS